MLNFGVGTRIWILQKIIASTHQLVSIDIVQLVTNHMCLSKVNFDFCINCSKPPAPTSNLSIGARLLYTNVRKLTAADVDVEEHYIPLVRSFLKVSSSLEKNFSVSLCHFVVSVLHISYRNPHHLIALNFKVRSMKLQKVRPWV